MDDETIRENELFPDNARMITNMIKNQWSLGAQNECNITFIPEQYMVNARVGSIFVYPISTTNQISSTDYHTLQRTARLGVKVSTRMRENHYVWCEEVYRILMANRRRGQKCMHGWLFLEVTGERQMTDLSGWYTTTFDIKLTTYAKPIRSAGFGDKVNKMIEDSINSNNGD